MKFFNFIVLVLLSSAIAFAQDITQIEYYFDTDPGLGNGSQITISAAPNVTDLTANIDISSLITGVHHLFLRTKDENGFWSFPFKQVFYIYNAPSSKNIVSAEYFINSDPGLGMASPIAFTPSSDINNMISVIDISTLANGPHQLSIRTKDASGQWSLTHDQIILKEEESSIKQIIKIEYFIDTDPGYGLGTSIPFSASTNVESLIATIDPTSIDNGVHSLHIRSQDNESKWSLNNTVDFVKLPAPPTPIQIIAAEFFINTDPGEGLGTPMTLSPSNDVTTLTKTIPGGSLSTGVHTLYVRSKDANGTWSFNHSFTIYKDESSVLKEITALEYFIGPDPGYGNGMSLSMSPGSDLSDLLRSIDVSSLVKGIYTLQVRSKNSNGIWSINHPYTFMKGKSSTPRMITDIEYYIGQDPGFGNGTSIPLSNSEDIVNLAETVDISALEDGIHELYFRSKDSDNIWSLNHLFIIKKLRYDPSIVITAGEYYFNTDPGVGNGISIPVSNGSNIGASIIVDVSNLDYGVHTLHSRFKDEYGNWSHNEIYRIKNIENTADEMVLGEYFFDIDPGFGNGMSFILDSIDNIVDTSIIVIPTGLTPGDHDLYIRIKDDQNRWSLTNVEVEIEVGVVLPLNWLSFDVTKLNENAILDWSVANAINTSHFEIQKLNDQGYQPIGIVKSKNTSYKQSFQYLDKDLSIGWNAYRIKQVDLDEAFTLSSMARIYHEDEFDLRVYPNPTPHHLNISLNQSQSIEYTLLDGQQKVVLTGRSTEKDIQIDFDSLSAGPYYLKIKNANKVKTFVIIKT